MRLHQEKTHSALLNLFRILVFFVGSLIFLCSKASAQEAADTAQAPAVEDSLRQAETPRPTLDVAAKDEPNDAGGSITVTWKLSPDDHEGGKVDRYLIYRAEDIDGKPGEFTQVGDATAGADKYTDGNTNDSKKYFYKVAAADR
ncbi:MAG: fibronectin type III domain-containing protein, partial [Acidobacteriota bacterium]